VRIVAGSLRGRRLEGPRGAVTRPTADRLRETLFQVLGPLEGLAVLDAYAGTGALGLEALSRGARAVTFVDADPRALAVVSANVRACGVDEACAIIRDDFLSPRARRPRASRPGAWAADRFDLVLLDPPYDVPDLTAVLDAAGPLTTPGGLVVLEHSRRRMSPESAARLHRTRVLEAGDSALSFYSAEPA
jgi:16S rRNA (guanine(966)-N(2))-methyltransferase RsmD